MGKISRNPFFDNIKILLMLSVILCHVLPIDLNNRTNLTVELLLLSINMPLFIFISGYFTKITDWGGVFWSRNT